MLCATAQDDIRKIAKPEIDAYLARESAGLVPYRSVIYPPNRRPACAVLKADPLYIGKSVMDYPDGFPEEPIRPEGDGEKVEKDGPQLKDFQLTGLNWLAYCWSRAENGILADEVCFYHPDYLLLTR